MTEPEIKPCPFCGSKDVKPTTYFGGDDCEEWRVFCCDCEAHGPPKYESRNENPIDAINSWNRAGTPDMFWLEDAPEEGGVNSAAEAVNLYYGDYCCLQRPVEVRTAAYLTNIWVVLSEDGDDIIENIFHTKEEAEQFYQKKDANNE